MAIALLLFLLQGIGFCEENSIKAKYFTVFYSPECSLEELLKKLNAQSFLHINALSRGSDSQNIESIASRFFDSLFLEVSDIVDIHIYSFQATIKIAANRAALPVDSPSFYAQSENTIYISCPDLDIGKLSHEIAHAIISHYFVVAPSAKVQEILCGYVEYSIRKKIN